MRTARPPRRLYRSTIAAAGIVFTALCATAPGAPAAVAQEGQARSGSAGCGREAQEPGTSTRHEITSGDRQREFVLHLPSDYDGTSALPVVLAYHGHGSTGARTEEYSKLSTLPAIVAYPEGLISEGDGNSQSWQGAPYAVPGVDDVAFTADLIDHLAATLCVDTARVYATGNSNGGGLTGLLACRLADRIAAVAPVAGAFYPGTSEGCRPARPIPVIELHGVADAVVPYRGGVRGLPAIPDWVAAWADRNGCQAPTPEERIEPDIIVTAWTGCVDGAEVRHVAVEGGGHTWPGVDIEQGDGATTQTIEAHKVVWSFMSKYQLPSVR